MSRVDIAELRRLLGEMDLAGDGWILRSMLVADAIPALLDELEAAREEVRRLTQAVGDLRKERDRAVKEAQRQDAVAKGLRKERDALAAVNERLRAALEEVRTHYPEDYKVRITEIIDTALAAKPAQSLAAHDAALLREVAGMLGVQQRELLLAEADRREQEAKNK